MHQRTAPSTMHAHPPPPTNLNLSARRGTRAHEQANQHLIRMLLLFGVASMLVVGGLFYRVHYSGGHGHGYHAVHPAGDHHDHAHHDAAGHHHADHEHRETHDKHSRLEEIEAMIHELEEEEEEYLEDYEEEEGSADYAEEDFEEEEQGYSADPGFDDDQDLDGEVNHHEHEQHHEGTVHHEGAVHHEEHHEGVHHEGVHHEGVHHEGVHHEGVHHEGVHHEGAHHDVHHEGVHHGEHHDIHHNAHHEGVHHEGVHHEGEHHAVHHGDIHHEGHDVHHDIHAEHAHHEQQHHEEVHHNVEHHEDVAHTERRLMEVPQSSAERRLNPRASIRELRQAWTNPFREQRDRELMDADESGLGSQELMERRGLAGGRSRRHERRLTPIQGSVLAMRQEKFDSLMTAIEMTQEERHNQREAFRELQMTSLLEKHPELLESNNENKEPAENA